MRKRISKKRLKIVSCTGTKLIRYVFILICVVVLASCKTNTQPPIGDSFDHFCKLNGTTPEEASDSIVNAWLDGYVGSVAEEEYFASINK